MRELVTGKVLFAMERNMKSTRFRAVVRVFGWIGFFALLSAPAFIGAAAGSSGFVIRNAKVFDGHKMVGQSDVWVEGGKIKSVGRNLKVPTDVKVVDGSGDTLLPGLIDSHTHVWADALKEAE